MNYNIWNPHNSLMHYEIGTGYGARQSSYSSPYYNYEKAHAYYEAHKQLKGRSRSTATLNNEGKKVWSYVNQQITEEKKSSIESDKVAMKNAISSIQNQITTLKGLAGNERNAKKAEIQQRITALRQQLAAKKEQLQMKLKAKQEQATLEKQRKSEETQNENQSIQEQATADNKRMSETIRNQNTQMQKSITDKKTKMAGDISKKREELKGLGNTKADKAKKEQLRQEISKMTADKQQYSSEASEYMRNYRADNSATLANYKSSNSTEAAKEKAQNSEDLKSFKEGKKLEVDQFRANNRAEVKSATERVNSAISSLRSELSSYNESSRAMTKEQSDALRANIQVLREANKANRQALNEKYEEIKNTEYEKVLENYAKKKKVGDKMNRWDGYTDTLDDLYHSGLNFKSKSNYSGINRKKTNSYDSRIESASYNQAQSIYKQRRLQNRAEENARGILNRESNRLKKKNADEILYREKERLNEKRMQQMKDDVFTTSAKYIDKSWLSQNGPYLNDKGALSEYGKKVMDMIADNIVKDLEKNKGYEDYECQYAKYIADDLVIRRLCQIDEDNYSAKKRDLKSRGSDGEASRSILEREKNRLGRKRMAGRLG